MKSHDWCACLLLRSVRIREITGFTATCFSVSFLLGKRFKQKNFLELLKVFVNPQFLRTPNHGRNMANVNWSCIRLMPFMLIFIIYFVYGSLDCHKMLF